MSNLLEKTSISTSTPISDLPEPTPNTKSTLSSPSIPSLISSELNFDLDNQNYDDDDCSSSVHLKVSRVSQLDADLLDKELGEILKSKLFQGLEYFRTDIQAKLEPELNAILQIILFRLSVMGPHRASYGSQLQNLRFRDEYQVGKIITANAPSPRSAQLWAYGGLIIGGQYLWARWNRWGIGGGWGNTNAQNNWRGRVYKWITRLEKYSKLISLIHFLVFLYNGKYRGISERLLGLRLVNGGANGPRQLNYEFLNRQLVWDGLTEFLMFVAPLINLERMTRAVRQLGTRLAGGKGAGDGEYTADHQKVLHALPQTTCALCYYRRHLSPDSVSLDPTAASDDIAADPRFMGSSDCRAQLPHVADCGHLFCYQCIQTSLITASSLSTSISCPRCSTPITTSTRYIQRV